MFVAIALPSSMLILCLLLLIVGISGAGHSISQLCGFLLDLSWLGLIVGFIGAMLWTGFLLVKASEDLLDDGKGSAVKKIVLATSLLPSEILSVVGMGQVLYAALVMFAYANFNDLLTIISAIPALILCGIMMTLAALAYIAVEGICYLSLKLVMGEVDSTVAAVAGLVIINIIKLILTVGVVALCQYLSMEIIAPDSGFYEYVLVGPVAQINDFCFRIVSPLFGGAI